MKPARWSAEQWADAEYVLQARAGQACERCGKQCGPVERHHRMRRREGGDSFAQILYLGRPCHQHIHAHPVEARKFGWIVATYRDPLTTPVLLRFTDWVYFDNEGGTVPAFAVEDAHA